MPDPAEKRIDGGIENACFKHAKTYFSN